MVDYRYFFRESAFFIFKIKTLITSLFPRLSNIKLTESEDSMNLYVDFLGYMGTLLLFVSMTMNSIQKLRLLNILGSVFTIVYSIIISAFPIVLLNLGLALLNAYKLLTDKNKGEQQ